MQLEPNANLPKRNVFSQREQDWFDCRVVEFKAIVVDGRTILVLVRCNEWQEPPIQCNSAQYTGKVPKGTYIFRFKHENGSLEDNVFKKKDLVDNFKSEEPNGWFAGTQPPPLLRAHGRSLLVW